VAKLPIRWVEFIHNAPCSKPTSRGRFGCEPPKKQMSRRKRRGNDLGKRSARNAARSYTCGESPANADLISAGDEAIAPVVAKMKKLAEHRCAPAGHVVLSF
jgi:hypothetical protein